MGESSSTTTAIRAQSKCTKNSLSVGVVIDDVTLKAYTMAWASFAVNNDRTEP